ncbi:estradiol 17-beta-dehydrogenase 8-like [Ixodes scapularis]|uniref:estradiol 17-beta-dehydrogenase 8-like n=1 Tax=Ixodes scapularis TaxID=6945 RepID=UPI001A9FA534|nr:estradiol 17-beta-dehydrogenase 8-like [Ixodes scapularis]
MSNASSFFKERLALVVGGGGGIGRCVCLAFAKEGYRVIVADMNFKEATAVAKSLTGKGHEALHVDVGESKSVALLFEDISWLCSQPASIVVNCIVVNCVGIGHQRTPFVELSEAIFDNIIRVNLKGTFLITQAAARAMTAGNVRDGAIVNISSFVSKLLPYRGAYAASKAGVVALTKVTAKELASQGICVNSVLPVLMTTPMTGTNRKPDERKKAVEDIPLKRASRPEEVADVIVFLCGPRSSFVTGAAVDIAGGL